MSVKEVEHLVDVSGLKSCDLVPVLARILKGCTSCMPEQLKEAMVIPKLKKESLDFEEYLNFRPISNLRGPLQFK